MVKLNATSPLSGLVPRKIGAVELSEVKLGQMTLVAPFDGKEVEISTVLMAALGVRFPDANRHLRSDRGRAIWVAGGQALVIGTVPDLSGLAAVTDQSDAFACLAISGGAHCDVLARLVPMDLRRNRFEVGQTARTLVGHMAASLTRMDDETIEIMVMRSMAASLVHDLTRAATGVQGRGKIISQ